MHSRARSVRVNFSGDPNASDRPVVRLLVIASLAVLPCHLLSAQLPSIGTTLAGQEIPLGGFSGLAFEGINPVTGRYKFVAHTDRGPNAEPTGILRPFLLPQFAPEVVRFELDRNTGALTLTERIQLKDTNGELLTGRVFDLIPASLVLLALVLLLVWTPSAALKWAWRFTPPAATKGPLI